jgi:hypothetical protein
LQPRGPWARATIRPDQGMPMYLKAFRQLLVAGALMYSVGIAPAQAHHSFAMFDFAKVITITGAVKEFQWTNPHVILWVNADAAAGAGASVWSLELTSPGNLTRTGWDRHALNAGDKVSVDLNPLRNGNHGGALVKVINLTSGKTYTTNLREMEKPGLK